MLVSKSPFEKDIDKPLGLPERRDRQGRRFISAPGAAQVMAGLVVVGVFAVSAWIALEEKPFRAPQQVVVSTPEDASSKQGGKRISAYPERSGAPSIIKVDPPAGTGEEGGSIIVRDPSALNYDWRVAHLPDKALIEEVAEGFLPIRSTDGRRPFDAYARPWSGARGARIAIVIGGLGVSQTGTEAAISRLPPEITLAFASGGNSLDRWMQTARRDGHEIVMQVPLEPFDYPQTDPGRNTMTVDADPAENRDRLYRVLSRITNYTGVMNYMGGRFVTDEAAMAPFFEELAGDRKSVV